MLYFGVLLQIGKYGTQNWKGTWKIWPRTGEYCGGVEAERKTRTWDDSERI